MHEGRTGGAGGVEGQKGWAEGRERTLMFKIPERDGIKPIPDRFGV